MTLPKYWQFGLVGYPLDHSLSPVLHQAALASAGLRGDYRLVPLSSAQQLPLVLEKLRAGELDGINVTIPYKQAVIPYLDGLSPAAGEIGAVNTVVIKEGSLIGENTDAPGFWKDLCGHVPSCREPGQAALVLGAGGAARAVVYALAAQGWQITVASRRLAQAELLADTLNFSTIQTVLWDTLHKPSFISNFNLLVNTTPLGLFPDIEHSPLDPAVKLPVKMVVYDLVYNPRWTALLKNAAVQGNQCINGLGMLVNQAAAAFEYWTGKTAAVEKMTQALHEKLGLEEK